MGVLEPDETPPTAAPVPPAPARPSRSRSAERRTALLLIGPAIALWVITQIASALLPQLATENQTLLIALSSTNRNLIIAASSAKNWLDQANAGPIFWYFLIGTGRLLLPDPFFYEIGRRYGDRAISWMERRTPTFGELMRTLERWFPKADWAIVLFTTNIPVCLLAGAAKMRRSWFWTLNVIGTVGRVLIMWYIGQTFQDVINTILGFVSDHRVPFLVVSVGFVAITMSREWRAGTSQAQALMELEHEIEERTVTDLSGVLTDERPETDEPAPPRRTS
jgi:membrane protein DedA with SNARE-associated domain